MPPKRKTRSSGEEGAAAAAGSSGAARRRTQPGIAEALATAGERAASAGAAADLVLEQPLQRDLLGRHLLENLQSEGDKYLQAWSEKCFEGPGGAVGGKGRGARARQGASAAAEEHPLDNEALKFLELFRHLQQQAFKHDLAFEGRQLEVLALMTRADVMHKLGDVSFQAYSLLHAYLQRFPYVRLGAHPAGSPWAGRPFLVVDERAAWEPLAAAADFRGLTKQYIFEEAIKEAGHNYRLDREGGGLAERYSRKKCGHLSNAFQLLKLCFDRAVDSVEEDHNGDVLLLRYLLRLLHQDLDARMQVFAAYADLEGDAEQRRRFGVLQNALLWRIWTDDQETDKSRQELVRLLMRLIVGVASEEELQEVEEEGEQHRGAGEEPASPCVCTPRELAAHAAAFLGMLLDMFGAAEAAGGFSSAGANRMHRHNQRLKLDQALKELFWKNKTDAVCVTGEAARTFLAALAPAHRLRLLSLVAMEHVGKAYYHEEAARRPALLRAKQLEALVRTADSGAHTAAFPADPVVALQCLNQDQGRCLKVFANVSGDTAVNNLAVLCCGIALAAHAMLATGQELPCSGGGGSEAEGSGSGAGGEARQQLQREGGEFLQFLANSHKAYLGGKRDGALCMSRASLLDLLHAQAAVTALG